MSDTADSLLHSKVLIIDCQTTGMRPSNGSLLEMAWAWVTAGDAEPQIHSRLVGLPEGESIPSRVSEITGIADADLAAAISLEDLRQEFLASVSGAGEPRPLAVIHYAQFERPFLEHLIGAADLPFDVVCTFQLSKRLFPNLPSRNIRGVSGFFGGRFGEIKRATEHVRATILIWQGLTPVLEEQGLRRSTDFAAWLKAAPKAKSVRYEYRVEKEKRLALPDRPGVYRMLSKSGEILYVGKATSLKDRVNSYFRGKRGRDKRKLELMAQVWDLQVTETRTAVEAALLESDEIKKHNPPYNVSLKTGRRRLIYYSRDYVQISDQQDEAHPHGPFRRFGNVERLQILATSLAQGMWHQVFYEAFPAEDLEVGFEIFLSRNAVVLSRAQLANPRSLLALGTQLLRRAVAEPIEESETEDEEASGGTALTPEELAAKFERFLMRAANEVRRARLMTKLLNARVKWQSPEGWVSLEVCAGSLAPRSAERDSRCKWRGLDIAAYDRMSILVSEIKKYPHEIEPI